MKRVGWIDAARYLAIFHIVFIHVLDMFCPALLAYWVTPPYSYLPFLFCAKDAVLFFCVLLGFFASKPRAFSLRGFGAYAVKRFFQFSFFILCTGALYVIASYGTTWLFHSPDPLVRRVLGDGLHYNLIYVLRDAFLLEDNYNPTLWSMQQFYISSILCYLLGCIYHRNGARVSLAVTLLAVSALLITGSEYLSWIAFCLIGVLFRIYCESGRSVRLMDRKAFRWAALLAAVLLYKLPESTAAYFLYSIASVLLLTVCMHSPGVQRLLGKAPLPALGRAAFGVFVVHTPVNSILNSSLFPLISPVLPAFCTVPIMFIVCILISTGGAWLLDTVYRKILDRVGYGDKQTAALISD